MTDQIEAMGYTLLWPLNTSWKFRHPPVCRSFPHSSAPGQEAVSPFLSWWFSVHRKGWPWRGVGRGRTARCQHPGEAGDPIGERQWGSHVASDCISVCHTFVKSCWVRKAFCEIHKALEAIFNFLSDQAFFICHTVPEWKKITMATSPLTIISRYSHNKLMKHYDPHFIDVTIWGLGRLSNSLNSP